MNMRYYTLIVRTPGQLWTPEFGDAKRAVVAAERDDTKDSWPKGTKMKIICTSGSQRDIREAVERLNDDLSIAKREREK